MDTLSNENQPQNQKVFFSHSAFPLVKPSFLPNIQDNSGQTLSPIRRTSQQGLSPVRKPLQESTNIAPVEIPAPLPTKLNSDVTSKNSGLSPVRKPSRKADRNTSKISSSLRPIEEQVKTSQTQEVSQVVESNSADKLMIEQLTVQLAKLQEQLNLEKQNVLSLDAQKSDLEKRNIDLETKFADLERNHTSLEKKNDDLEKEIADFEKQTEELSKQTSELEKQTVTLEKHTISLEKQNFALEKQNSSLESLLQTKETEISELQTVSRSKDSLIVELREGLQTKESMINELREETKMLSAQILGNQERIDYTVDRRESLQRKLVNEQANRNLVISEMDNWKRQYYRSMAFAVKLSLSTLDRQCKNIIIEDLVEEAIKQEVDLQYYPVWLSQRLV